MHHKTPLILIAIVSWLGIFIGVGYLVIANSASLPSSYSPSKAGNEAVHEKVPEQDEGDYVTVIAVGDIMPSRMVAQKIKQHGIEYPFARVENYLKQADIFFANLESPIAKGRVIASGEMSFRTNPGFEEAFKDFGSVVVSLANNHTPNFGERGLKETFSNLTKAGIAYVGAGNNEEEANQPVYISEKGITLAFLAYNDTDVVPDSYFASAKRAGTAEMKIDHMQEAVKTAKNNADFVIVSMHSGIEYKATATTSQTVFAHAAIDAGAEMVIGHHPHVVQNGERYKGKYIFYSLGNFIFDQMWSQNTREGLTLKARFNSDGLQGIQLVPIRIYDYAQPRLLSGRDAQRVMKRVRLSYNASSGELSSP